ncbi:ABC transporter ATP-binding protein [Candidatus Bathyarchaeota archaeon]|nr:ABC transporter ATP-binding protein [Candidatus Bathyarchaeota archaeon]
MPLLEVNQLKTYFRIARGYVRAVDNVSFTLEKGEAIGLAGESGCGKTTTALSILRILPSNGEIKDGNIVFSGMDITKIPDEKMRKDVRWKGISIVFQGAMNAFNPVFRVGDQLVEAIKLHEDVRKSEAETRGKKLFELVGIEPSRFSNYPHEFSGGMKQRALIAMSIASNPSILIADEPGTALDVIVQAQILKLLRELKKNLNLSMILITHDLSIIAETCEKTAIMYAGKIVEYGSVFEIFREPLHPYTIGLLSAFPNIKAAKTRMKAIPGFPPDLLDPPPGCRFHPRCKYAMGICKYKEPALIPDKKGRSVACHLVNK